MARDGLSIEPFLSDKRSIMHRALIVNIGLNLLTISVAAYSAPLPLRIPPFAQSSLNLYGESNSAGAINAATEARVVGDREFKLDDSVHRRLGTTSTFGLTGNDDLGGGNRFIFTLETQVNHGENDNKRDFLALEQAYAGVTSDRFGTLSFGRQTDTMRDFVAPHTAIWKNNSVYNGTYSLAESNLGYPTSWSNSLKYLSPDYYGLKFGGLYSLGSNYSGKPANRQVWGFGLSYANGPVMASAGYLNVHDNGAAGIEKQNDFVLRSNTSNRLGAGLTYTFGPATVGVVWTNSWHDDIYSGPAPIFVFSKWIDSSHRPSLSVSEIELNGKYSVKPNLSLSGSVAYTRGKIELMGTHLPKEPPLSASAQLNCLRASMQLNYSITKCTDIYVGGAVASINAKTDIPAYYHNRPYSTPQDFVDLEAAATVGIRYRF